MSTYRGEVTTDRGVRYTEYVTPEGKAITSDDLGHEHEKPTGRDLYAWMCKHAWVDLMGNMRITGQDCPYARENWFKHE